MLCSENCHSSFQQRECKATTTMDTLLCRPQQSSLMTFVRPEPNDSLVQMRLPSQDGSQEVWGCLDDDSVSKSAHILHWLFVFPDSFVVFDNEGEPIQLLMIKRDFFQQDFLWCQIFWQAVMSPLDPHVAASPLAAKFVSISMMDGTYLDSYTAQRGGGGIQLMLLNHCKLWKMFVFGGMTPHKHDY